MVADRFFRVTGWGPAVIIFTGVVFLAASLPAVELHNDSTGGVQPLPSPLLLESNSFGDSQMPLWEKYNSDDWFDRMMRDELGLLSLNQEQQTITPPLRPFDEPDVPKEVRQVDDQPGSDEAKPTQLFRSLASVLQGYWKTFKETLSRLDIDELAIVPRKYVR